MKEQQELENKKYKNVFCFLACPLSGENNSIKIKKTPEVLGKIFQGVRNIIYKKLKLFKYSIQWFSSCIV